MSVLATALVLAGCGGDDGSSGSGLVDALGKVRATSESRKFVEFGAPGRVPEGERFRSVTGYGYGQVAQTSIQVRERLGLDLAKFDAGIVAGQPPRWVGAVWGEYDSSAVEGKLAELGATREKEELGGTLWRTAEDGEMDPAGGRMREVVQLNQFNTIRTAGDSFAYSPAAAELEWVAAPGDDTLADDEAIGPLARCLGDVVAAMLTDAGQAVGVREDGTEVICLDADRAAVERALAGDVPSTRQPWAELLPGAKVDESDGRTRVTVAPSDDRPVGRVMQMLQRRDLDGLG